MASGGLETIYARVRAREAGRDLRWYLDAATYFAEELELARAEDYLVDNEHHSAAETSREILRLIGWLETLELPHRLTGA